MKRVMLRIAYDGTNYCGWQIQKNGTAVEAVVNAALSELLGEEIAVIGASRTDSGVHAMGNVAVFDTSTRIPADKICFALNQRLPYDITVQGSQEVPADFHPRHCECNKTYEYKILNRRFDLPVYRLYSHFVYYPLDLEQMQKAARYFVGEHDFASFASSGGQAKTTVRKVNSLELFRDGDMITMRINGNGFLYNMVRIIAGTLIKVGLHAYPPEHVREILEACDRSVAGPTAPARGLTLVEINYAEELLQAGQEIEQ